MSSLECFAAAWGCMGACVLICLYAWTTRDITPLDRRLAQIDDELDQAARHPGRRLHPRISDDQA